MNNTNQNIKDLTSYIKKVSTSYDKTSSLTDILNNFRLLTPEYQKLNNSKTEFSYSDYNFINCTKEEQERFINSELLTLEALVCNSIYDRSGRLFSWYDIYSYIINPSFNNVDKTKRHVVYSTCINNRPIGDDSIIYWNGLQIIDLDIKDEELSSNLKPLLFEELKKYNWFLGLTKSASKKSIHIWTKISPISIKAENKQIEYLCNFRHKYSYIYIVLSKYASKFNYTTDDITTFMDMAMAKHQQGIFVPSDETAMLNTNFIDTRLDANFESAFDNGVESIDWISHPALKTIFSKLEWFNNDKFDKDNNVNLTDVENVDIRDNNKNTKKHYKHHQRWQLANTLTNIYGSDKALQYMLEICKNTPYRELKGDVKTAEIHNKPISIWAIKQLNTYHGFNIKIKEDTNVYLDKQERLEEINYVDTKDIVNVLNTSSNSIQFYLKSNQYLSDLKEDIIKNLSQITLLEAGAGYGKTEMIKSLKAKTCLILPFTSTIKSKIEKSEVTEDWLYYYGNKRPTLDDLLGHHNMSMTIDKFSRLNVMELDQANFEYIVLDESHLLFTSSYRDVMAPTIQRLANCKAKIILMTGTPTGELTFFPGIKHIKVTKEDTRIKNFDIHFCNSQIEQILHMCKMMTEDIIEGRKVLFPTNKGNLFFEQVTGIIQDLLDQQNFGRQLNKFYYKKSNYGDDSMDNINYDKTIGNNDIIFCTTYLSVGVDICDRYTFSVYFNETWIPQDIEQFANRLRNNDLYVRLILPKNDNEGIPINYYLTYDLNLKFNDEELLLARDLIRMCNDLIERNNDESKSNPLIQSIISANKFLKYDENMCKYYIDETTYKLKVFEERYSDYSKQLTVLINGLRYYGYTITQIDHTEIIPEDKVEQFEQYMKDCRTRRYNEVTSQTMIFLSSINDNNIEVYREIIKGNLDILKGRDDKNIQIREDSKIYTENVEVVEKNTPIVLSLYRYYNCDTIVDIYKYCTDKKQNRINYTKLTRIRKFISIVNAIKKNRLDFPIYKYVTDAKKFAIEHPIAKTSEIEKFNVNAAVRIANNIKDVVVEDRMFLEMIHEHIKQLWSCIIIQSRPKKEGNVSIEPFELLWETKDKLDTVYGGNITKTFFMQELIDEMKDTEELTNEEALPKSIDENVDLPELELTSKVKLSDVQQSISDTIKETYDYYEYSELDGSNDRFMEKQRNTNSLREQIFNTDDDNDNNKLDDSTIIKETTLF